MHISVHVGLPAEGPWGGASAPPWATDAAATAVGPGEGGGWDGEGEGG